MVDKRTQLEYKRMAIFMGEGMGCRIDELAPLLAAPLAVAGHAARTVGTVAGRTAAAGGQTLVGGAKSAAMSLAKRKARQEIGRRVGNVVGGQMEEAKKVVPKRKSTLRGAVDKISLERRAARFQRPQPGIDYEDQNVSMEGTELKMNKYVQALTEVRGRRVRTTRSNRTSDKRPAATTDPRPVGGRITHSPGGQASKKKAKKKKKAKMPGGEEVADDEVERLKDMPAPRTSQQNDWTKYQRIGRILAERRGPPGPESERTDPQHGVHPDAERKAVQGAATEAPDLTPEEKAKEHTRLQQRSKEMLERLRSRTRPPVTASPRRRRRGSKP